MHDFERFLCKDWNSIRFSESQKKYLTTPGYIELNINDILRPFESKIFSEVNRLHLLERSFAALFNAVLGKRKNCTLLYKKLVDWSNLNKSTLTPTALFQKI